MFERVACPDQRCLAKSPFVSMSALTTLSDLIDRASKNLWAASNVCLQVRQNSPTTRIGGRLMTKRKLSRPSPIAAQSRRRRASGDAQQIDLFSDASPTSPMQTPAWQELPKEIRTSLTSLLARLLLDHAQASSAVSRTRSRPRPRRRSTTPTVDSGRPSRRPMAGPAMRCSRSPSIFCSAGPPSCVGLRCGREERSASPASPACHFRCQASRAYFAPNLSSNRRSLSACAASGRRTESGTAVCCLTRRMTVDYRECSSMCLSQRDTALQREHYGLMSI
jgi:hypothetical protein